MRVVFDTSIWVSALEYGGVPRTAVEFAAARDEVLLCDQLENEIIETLANKFARSAKKTRKRIELLAEDAAWVLVPGLLFGICRDPKDDFILECAILGNADAIVTATKICLPSATTKTSESSPRGNTWTSSSIHAHLPATTSTS